MLRSPDLFLPPVRLLGSQAATGRRLESEQHAIPGDVQSELARCEPELIERSLCSKGSLGVRSSRRAARLRMSDVRQLRPVSAHTCHCFRVWSPSVHRHSLLGRGIPAEAIQPMKMPLDDLRRTEHCREGTQRRQAFSQHARWSALQPLAATRTQPIVSARRWRRRCSVRSSRWSDGRRGIGRRASRFECCARRRRDLDTAGGGPRMLAV